jgi:ferredoxin/flavodoxin---NADP+ reductase
MAYVVTQSCCSDASCVVACPVNCIHPAPGEPGFAEAEMVYIDANSCVGCGACVTACPVGAIKPDSALTPAEQPFAELAAEYFDTFPHAERTPLALVPAQRRLTERTPRRVAVVGAGPAGLYAADELLKHPEVSVDVLERLETPHGLARYGVAPDHPRTREVNTLFEKIERQPRFRYRLGVQVGVDVTLDELATSYDAVLYAVGAASDKRLGVPGESLRGSVSATDLVGWYNGHPDKASLDVPLDTRRAVVVGNGNVALDVARILTGDPEALERTDISRPALEALWGSELEEVVVLGRRGVEHAAFTTPELVGLAAYDGADVVFECTPPQGEGVRERLLRELSARTPIPGRRRIVFRFDAPVTELVAEPGGDERVCGVRLADRSVLETGLVVRAIGYRGLPVRDLPYDEATGVVPNDRGRVRPGVYVAGWVKRGPTGFLGTNKADAEETVEQLLDDLDQRAVDGYSSRVHQNSAGHVTVSPGTRGNRHRIGAR